MKFIICLFVFTVQNELIFSAEKSSKEDIVLESLSSYKNEFSSSDNRFKFISRLTDGSSAKALSDINCTICRCSLLPKSRDTQVFELATCEEEDELFSFDGCRHIFHKKCLSDSLKFSIANHIFPLYCPEGASRQCSSLITCSDIESILEPSDIEEMRLKFLRGELVVSSDFRLCPVCESYVAMSDGGSWVKFCKYCEKNICFTCAGEHSSELSCVEANDKLNLEFSLAYLAIKKKETALVWKLCQNCGSPYDKKDGCDAVVCGLDAPDKRSRGKNIREGSGCGVTFSWSTARDFVPMPRSEFLFNFMQFELQPSLDMDIEKTLVEVMNKDELISAFFESRETDYWPEVMNYFKNRMNRWADRKRILFSDTLSGEKILSLWNASWGFVWSSSFKCSGAPEGVTNSLRDEHWLIARKGLWKESWGEYTGLSCKNTTEHIFEKIKTTFQKDLIRKFKLLGYIDDVEKALSYSIYEYIGILFFDKSFEEILECYLSIPIISRTNEKQNGEEDEKYLNWSNPYY